MTTVRLLFAAVALLLLSACSMLPSQKSDVYALHDEAQIAYIGEQDDRAEKLLLGLSRAAPSDPETWFYLGNLYARTNRPEQAVDAYQKSLLLNSTDPRVWHNLGVVRVREAWAAFIQAENLAKSDDPLHAKLTSLIGAMEKIPLDGMDKTPKAPVAAPSDNRK
jgi:cytochrome c-type biogenesis protein CcmH/NrfG